MTAPGAFEMPEFTLTIGGRATGAPGTLRVLNPADETTVGECPEGTPALVDLAVASAREALPAW